MIERSLYRTHHPYTGYFIVHIYIRISEHEASTRLTLPGPQWDVTPGHYLYDALYLAALL